MTTFLFEHEKQSTAMLRAGVNIAKAAPAAIGSAFGKVKGMFGAAPKPAAPVPSLSGMAAAASYPKKAPGLLGRAAAGYERVTKPMTQIGGAAAITGLGVSAGTNAFNEARGIHDYSTGMAQGAAEGTARFMHALDKMGPMERLMIALRGSNAFSGPSGQKAIASFINNQQDPTAREMLPMIFQEAFKRRDQLRSGQQGIPARNMFAPGSTVEQYSSNMQRAMQDMLRQQAPAA